MPKRKRRTLSRRSGARHVLLQNVLRALFTHGRVKTTRPRSRELVRLADRMVTLAKKGTVSARRQAFSVIRDREVVRSLFEKVGPRFTERQGGYTRVVRLGERQGDSAPMVLVQLTEWE